MYQFNPDEVNLLFMKVGVHADEPLESILERKQKEVERTGFMFWGYGGGTCHPLTQVQPFARETIAAGKKMMIAMQEIESHHTNPTPATEFSKDGLTWEPIPEDIKVTGSRYALVLEELVPGDLDLNLGELGVGIGNCRGKLATDYIQGRIDKACLSKATSPGELTPVHISLTANLLEPYAVLLRST